MHRLDIEIAVAELLCMLCVNDGYHLVTLRITRYDPGIIFRSLDVKKYSEVQL
jgi:hypothetical protein